MGQAIRAITAGRIGAARRLLRGMGMGGTAIPFLWAVGFDVVLICVAAGCAAHIFFDDVALSARGAKQSAKA